MATKTPGKLDIKSLQSKFEQTKQKEEPIISQKRGFRKDQQPASNMIHRESIRPPPRGAPQNSTQTNTDKGKAQPPAPLAKPQKPPPSDFKNTLESTLQNPRKPTAARRAVSPTRSPPASEPSERRRVLPAMSREDASHDDLEKVDSIPTTPPPPVPTDEPPEPPPSFVYKGKRLPSRVEVNGVLYKLTPLTPDNGEPAPSRPPRPPEVVPIVPDDADADEIYDNNKNLMSSISREEMDRPVGFPGYEVNDDENYDECVVPT